MVLPGTGILGGTRTTPQNHWKTALQAMRRRKKLRSRPAMPPTALRTLNSRPSWKPYSNFPPRPGSTGRGTERLGQASPLRRIGGRMIQGQCEADATSPTGRAARGPERGPRRRGPRRRGPRRRGPARRGPARRRVGRMPRHKETRYEVLSRCRVAERWSATPIIRTLKLSAS